MSCENVFSIVAENLKILVARCNGYACPLSIPTKDQAAKALKSLIRSERDGRLKKALAVKLIRQDYGYDLITMMLDLELTGQA